MLVAETIFLAISVFIRPIVWSGLASLVFVRLVSVISNERIPELKFVSDIIGGPLATQNISSVVGYLLLSGIRFAVGLMILVVSIIIFENRDL